MVDDKKVSYPCIFEAHKDCQVKNAFKLAPESLVTFCAICKTPSSELNPQMFQVLRDWVMMLMDLKEKMGALNAQIEIYKPFFDKHMDEERVWKEAQERLEKMLKEIQGKGLLPKGKLPP